MTERPRIFWFRRDLRLADHPGLTAAAAGGPVIPVFVLDPETEALGAASRWRLGQGLAVLDAALHARGAASSFAAAPPARRWWRSRPRPAPRRCTGRGSTRPKRSPATPPSRRG